MKTREKMKIASQIFGLKARPIYRKLTKPSKLNSDHCRFKIFTTCVFPFSYITNFVSNLHWGKQIV